MITPKISTLFREKFPTAEAVWEAILHLQLGLLLFTLLFVCCSCGITKRIYGEQGRTTQTVRDVHKDTVYLSNIQYDSIYISQDKVIDRSKDTLYIRDVSVEYRYRLLRDTVRIVQKDSIPYEVTVIETREIKRPLTFFDKICRASFTFLLILVLIYTRSIVKRRYNP